MTSSDRAWFKSDHTPPTAFDGNKRSTGRLRPGSLMCDHGRVLDISSGGMRVLTRGKPRVSEGKVFPTHLRTPAGDLRVMCYTVWLKKIGFRRWELGVRFVDVTHDIRSALSVLAAGIVRESDLSREG